MPNGFTQQELEAARGQRSLSSMAPRFVTVTRPDGRQVRVLESALSQLQDRPVEGPNTSTISLFNPEPDVPQAPPVPVANAAGLGNQRTLQVDAAGNPVNVRPVASTVTGDPVMQERGGFAQQAQQALETTLPQNRLGGAFASEPIADEGDVSIGSLGFGDQISEAEQQVTQSIPGAPNFTPPEPPPVPQPIEGAPVADVSDEDARAITSTGSSFDVQHQGNGLFSGFIRRQDGTQVPFENITADQAIALSEQIEDPAGRAPFLQQFRRSVPTRGQGGGPTSTVSGSFETQLGIDSRFGEEVARTAEEAERLRLQRDLRQQDVSLAGVEGQEQQSEAIRQQMEEAQANEQRRQAEIQRRMGALDRTIVGIENRSIDSQRLLNGNGGLNRIVAALAVGLGGQGAAQIVTSAIDRDIQEQRANLQNQSNVAQMRASALSQLQSLFRDERSAEEALRILHLRWTQAEIQKRIAEGNHELLPVAQDLEEATLQANQALQAAQNAQREQPSVSVQTQMRVPLGQEGRALGQLSQRLRQGQNQAQMAPSQQETLQQTLERARRVRGGTAGQRQRVTRARARLQAAQSPQDQARAQEELQAAIEVITGGEEAGIAPVQAVPEGTQIVNQTTWTRASQNEVLLREGLEAARLANSLEDLRSRALSALSRIDVISQNAGVDISQLSPGLGSIVRAFGDRAPDIREAMADYDSAMQTLQNADRVIRGFGTLTAGEVPRLEQRAPSLGLNFNNFSAFFNTLTSREQRLNAQINELNNEAASKLQSFLGLRLNSRQGAARQNARIRGQRSQ